MAKFEKDVQQRTGWAARRAAAVLLISALCGAPVLAQEMIETLSPAADTPVPELTAEATLSDYLSYAAMSNPGLQAALGRWRAAQEKVPQARALPDPKFSYGYYVDEVETRVGPQRQRFAVSQMIPWIQKLGLRGEIAENAAGVQQEKFVNAKLKLFYRVKRLYYEFIYLHRAIAIAEENVQLLTHLEGVAKTKYRTGSGLQSALVRIQLELERVRDRLENLSDMKRSLTASFNAALNRPVDAHFPVPKVEVGSQPDAGLDISAEELGAWLKESNPELRAVQYRVAKERTAIRLAAKNYLPDFAFGVQYIDTDDALNPEMTDSGKDPIITTLTVNLPIWFGKYRAAKREAEYNYAAATDERADLENRLIADLEEAHYRFRDADRRVRLYRGSLVPLAEQSLEVTLSSFSAGTSGILDLIDAERMLLDLELGAERAFADRAQALARIEMFVGRELSE